MKKLLVLGAAVVLALTGLFAGCKEDEMKKRTLRELPADFKYEVDHEEHVVDYTDSEGNQISLFGQIYAPTEDGKYPAVILSHGFNGHYTDFPGECQAFAERGYVCYAFDYCGAQSGGRSKGRTSADYTPFTMKEDLGAAIADLKELSNVDSTQIFLFGGSQGGFVTGLTAADKEIRDQIAAIVMYFPAFNIPDDWRGKPVQNTPLMNYSIGAKFIESVQDLYPFDVIGDFEGDVCIIWGDRDALVARKYIDGAVTAYGESRVDLTVISDAGHGFEGAALGTAIEKALAFLEAHTYETE